MSINITLNKLLFVLLLMLAACNTNAQTSTDKKKLVAQYKTEMKSLLDSSSLYLDTALIEASKNIKSEDLNKRLLPKLDSCQKKLDLITREFSLKAIKLKMFEDEVDKIMEELNKYILPIQQKIENLQKKGVNI